MSLNAELQLDLSEDAKTPSFGPILEAFIETNKLSSVIPFVFGRVKTFKPKVRELKVFKGDEELMDEAARMNKRIQDLRDPSGFSRDQMNKFALDTLFGNTLPLFPFPDADRCLGLRAADSEMMIKEGYAVLAFDYSVEKAGKCLFEMAKLIQMQQELME